MSSLKTLVVAVVLAAAAYGAYVFLHGPPTGRRATDDDSALWQEPEIELPAPEAALPGDVGEAGGDAPTFIPADQEGPPPLAAEGGALPPPSADFPDDSASAPSGVDVALPDAPPHDLPDADLASAEVPAAPYPQTEAASPLPYAPVAEQAGGSFPSVDPAAAAEAADQLALEMETRIEPLLRSGQLDEALLLLSPWLNNSLLAPADHRQLQQLLGQLAGTVVYSREHYIEPAHVVQAGETLPAIADRYGVSYQLLAKINNVTDPAQLPPGRTLKVVRGPFDAQIDLSDLTLTVHLRGRYAGQFFLGAGTDVAIQPGEYDVQDKVYNPTYYGAEATVDADDPANPLGEMQIDLGRGLSLHGTPDPGRIGQRTGPGCLALAAPDDLDVFDILSVGSRVTIRP